MDLKQLIATLHPLERKAVPHLEGCSSESGLVAKSGMQNIEVVRALGWLANKEVISLTKETTEMVSLGSNGKKGVDSGLPERRFLDAIKENSKGLKEISEDAKLDGAEVNICIGLLKRKQLINFESGKTSITDAGKAYLGKESLEEKFLKKLSQGAIAVGSLVDEEKFALNELKGRKDVIVLKTATEFKYGLTEIGKELVKQEISEDVVDRLTSKMLSSGGWKGKDIRRYDVTANVPDVFGGKRHFVRQATDYAKKIWLELGFKEMQGGIIQTSFWNFDALFTAQDHPVREMHDTFFILEPSHGKLPDAALVKSVKDVHENGGTTGATGWGGEWKEEEAKRNVLRTHTTSLSVPTLASLREEDLPAKFFSVGRCFRNETLDWCHLFEFNMTEGIVVDPDANFKHLLGYLKTFFKKMGFEKVRFRPAYFPYTEPSVEIDAFHPVHKKWIELGGAGVFRPEVVVPLLGKDIPVLAWGPGLDRVLTDYYKINDLRDLYKNDIKQTRNMKMWLK